MSSATIRFRKYGVRKTYPDTPTSRQRFATELAVYQDIPWASPDLRWHGDLWLETRRCTPILDLPKDEARKHRDRLWDLLAAVHAAGWWHRDVSLVNVVVHPTRGPLLIDWELAVRATSDVSYDLHGAEAAGVEPAFPTKGGNGVWWGAERRHSPGSTWGKRAPAHTSPPTYIDPTPLDAPRGVLHLTPGGP